MAINLVDNCGGVGDGSTPNDAQLLSCLAQWTANDGAIYVPAGRYLLTSRISQTLISNNSLAGFSMFGDGPNASKFVWPAGEGMEIVQTNAKQGITVRDVSFLTGAAGANGASALKLSSISAYADPAQSSLTRVSFQGIDGGGGSGLHWWPTGCEISGWECFNFDTVMTYGATQKGIGVRLAGVNGKYGILYNFKGCFGNFCHTGILYDGWVQGVTVTGGGNYNQCLYGIHSPPGAQGDLAQLSVSNIQFDCLINAICTETQVGGAQISSCQMFVRDGRIGVYLPQSLFPQISNNLIMGNGPASNSQAWHIGGSPLAGNVGGNILRNLGIAGVLDAGTSGVVVGPNAYSGNGSKTLNWAGSANTIMAGEA